MLTPVNNCNSELFQNYENHTGNENNIFLNSNIEFIESYPEILGTNLADIWLYLAKKHQKNELNANESGTILENIHKIIPKIEKMDGDNKKLTCEFFTAKIAYFNAEERKCLIQFFKNTLTSGLEDCNFKFFCQLGHALEPNYQSDFCQIKTGVFFEINKNNLEYTERLANLCSLMPNELQEFMLADYKRKNEICKHFKIKDIWNKVQKEIKDLNLNTYSNKNEFLLKITNNNISIDSLNLNDDALDDFIKDKALDYINLEGKLPSGWCNILWGNGKKVFFSNDQQRDKLFNYYEFALLINWLGFDRARKIKKIEFEIENCAISLSDLSFNCPNIEELSIDLSYYHNEISMTDKYYLDNILKDLENIHLFSNFKKLKISNFKSLNFLISIIFKLSFCRIPENIDLILDLREISALEWSKEYNNSKFKFLPSIGNINKLTILVPDPWNNQYEEAYKGIFSTFVDAISLDILSEEIEIKTSEAEENLIVKLDSEHLASKTDLKTEKNEAVIPISEPSILNPMIIEEKENLVAKLAAEHLAPNKDLKTEKDEDTIFKPVSESPIEEASRKTEKNEVFRPISGSLILKSMRELKNEFNKPANIAGVSLGAFLALGINSFITSTHPQIVPSLPNSTPLEKIGLAATGAFLTLAANTAINYYRNPNPKSKTNEKFVKRSLN